MTRTSNIRGPLAAAAALTLVSSVVATGSAHGSFGRSQGLGDAAGATARYHAPSVATDDGYALPGEEVGSGLLSKCVNNPEFPEQPGAMGFHWINFGLVDETLDPAAPEVLVYEPTENGRLRLVAMEYVVFAGAVPDGEPPELFGRELTLVPAPNRYGLPAFYQVHVWLWKHNPHGLFADHNPRVTCEHAASAGQ